MSINSPFDLVKDQLDNLHSQVKIAKDIIAEQNKKIDGLNTAIADYTKAIDELRFLGVGNKNYGVNTQTEKPIETGRSMGR